MNDVFYIICGAIFLGVSLWYVIAIARAAHR